MLWRDLQASTLSTFLFQAQVKFQFRHVEVSGINVVIISANRVDVITPRKSVNQKHKESIFRMKIKACCGSRYLAKQSQKCTEGGGIDVNTLPNRVHYFMRVALFQLEFMSREGLPWQASG